MCLIIYSWMRNICTWKGLEIDESEILFSPQNLCLPLASGYSGERSPVILRGLYFGSVHGSCLITASQRQAHQPARASLPHGRSPWKLIFASLSVLELATKTLSNSLLSKSRSWHPPHSTGVLPYTLEGGMPHRKAKKNLSGRVLLGFPLHLLALSNTRMSQ